MNNPTPTQYEDSYETDQEYCKHCENVEYVNNNIAMPSSGFPCICCQHMYGLHSLKSHYKAKSNKPTQAQINKIREIENKIHIKYTGNTQQDATRYITQHKYKLQDKLNYFNY